MNGVDVGITIIMILSCTVGALRGFVKETISLLSWLVAAWFAITNASAGAQTIIPMVGNEAVALLIALIGIFIAVLMLGAIMNKIISFVIAKVGLGPFDKIIGILFGFIRGVILIVMILYAAILFDFNHTATWESSVLVPFFMKVLHWFQVQGVTTFITSNVSGKAQQLLVTPTAK